MVAVAVAAVPVVGAASAHSQTSPVYRVSFRLTAVGKARPPDIVETRIAGSGRFLFDRSPVEGASFGGKASATGTVVVEFDVLSPHPQTEQLRLAVIKGLYHSDDTGSREYASVTVKVTASTTSGHLDCPVGDVGEVGFLRYKTSRRTSVSISLPDCGIRQLQTATTARNSRVHVSFTAQCLRTTSTAGQPLCGSPNPSKLTLTVNGTNAAATKAAPSAHVPIPSLASGAPLTINVATDEPMPKGWKVVVYHNGDPLSQGNGVYYEVCKLDDTSDATSCGDTRPGRTGPLDDIVFAELLSTTGLVFYAEVEIHFNAP